jgi:hypothetical protein
MPEAKISAGDKVGFSPWGRFFEGEFLGKERFQASTERESLKG